MVREKVTVVNRLQKVLEWANLKLASVVSDINGVSARKMLAALVSGTEDSKALADLAVGSLQHKRQQLEQALSGRVREHHRFLIASHLNHLDFLEAQIAAFDSKITQHLSNQTPLSPPPTPDPASPPQFSSTPDTSSPLNPLSWEEAVKLLDTIPGVARRTAELLLAEIGLDMSRFPTAGHLAKWARLCPGNYKGKEHLLTRLCRGIKQLGYQVSLQLPSPPTV